MVLTPEARSKDQLDGGGWTGELRAAASGAAGHGSRLTQLPITPDLLTLRILFLKGSKLRKRMS